MAREFPPSGFSVSIDGFSRPDRDLVRDFRSPRLSRAPFGSKRMRHYISPEQDASRHIGSPPGFAQEAPAAQEVGGLHKKLP
jgi:hypothetical protein